MDNSLGQKIIGSVRDLAEMIGFDTNITLFGIIARLINIFLSFLGIIFLALIIYSGFVYMLSRGNPQEVKKSLDTIKNSIIGLLIILSSYAITTFIFNSIINSANY